MSAKNRPVGNRAQRKFVAVGDPDDIGHKLRIDQLGQATVADLATDKMSAMLLDLLHEQRKTNALLSFIAGNPLIDEEYNTEEDF